MNLVLTGKTIARLRTQAVLTQARLAEKLGIKEEKNIYYKRTRETNY